MALVTVPLFEDSVVTEVESDARGLSGTGGGKKVGTKFNIFPTGSWFNPNTHNLRCCVVFKLKALTFFDCYAGKWTEITTLNTA